jgi:hypothetical protein
LKFGPEIRTPAMQAGPVFKRLSFREVFVATPSRIIFVIVFIGTADNFDEAGEHKIAA